MPEKHWTSSFRSRAGYAANEFDPVSHASFTFTEEATCRKIAETLLPPSYGLWLKGFYELIPVYHVDVAVSMNKTSPGSFMWIGAKFERIRRLKFQAHDGASRRDVAILVYVSDVHSVPKFQIFSDPWALVSDGAFSFSAKCGFTGTLFNIPDPNGAPVVVNGSTLAPSSSPSANPAAGSVWNGSHVPQQFYNPVNILYNGAAPGPYPTFFPSYYHYGPYQGPPMPFPASSTTTPPPESHYGSSAAQNNVRYFGNSRSYSVQGRGFTLRTDCDLNFTYNSLTPGHIRILLLNPGDGSDVRGTIVTAPLSAPGRYQAVSYTWGNPERSHTLWTTNGVIKISKSLYQVLVAIRDERNVLPLWVDAVCINQEDPKEKAAQIRLLPRIFQDADQVLAYVHTDEEATGALETLMQIHAQEIVNTCNEDWPEELARIPHAWKNRAVPLLDDPDWKAIRAFFQSPWFERAWVIQEVVAAFRVSVIHQTWQVEWDDLVHSMAVIERELSSSSENNCLGEQQQHGWGSGKEWNNFLTLSQCREREARGHHQSLLELLTLFRSAKSTLQRDRLFSLLGLSTDGNDEAFAPDYEAPFEVIVKRFASGFVRQGHVLELLHSAGISSQPARFPSWIPDWTAPPKTMGSLRELAIRGMPARASPVPTVSWKLEPGSDEIEVQATIVDKIAVVVTEQNTPENSHAYLQEVENTLESRGVPNANLLKWKVPIAGCRCPPDTLSVPGSSATQDVDDMEASYRALMEYYEWKTPKPKTKTTYSQTSILQSTLPPPQKQKQQSPDWTHVKSKNKRKNKKQRSDNVHQPTPSPPATAVPAPTTTTPHNGVAPGPDQTSTSTSTDLPTASSLWIQSQTYLASLHQLQDRQMIVTQRNFAGLAPVNAAVGDMVVVIDGGMVPFVVRESPWRRGAYQLVGECFVEGYMEGEAVRLGGVERRMLRLH